MRKMRSKNVNDIIQSHSTGQSQLPTVSQKYSNLFLFSSVCVSVNPLTRLLTSGSNICEWVSVHVCVYPPSELVLLLCASSAVCSSIIPLTSLHWDYLCLSPHRREYLRAGLHVVLCKVYSTCTWILLNECWWIHTSPSLCIGYSGIVQLSMQSFYGQVFLKYVLL